MPAAEIPLEPGSITCYFVRHGERIDHIDDAWASTSPTPYDPPLTADGQKQAYLTGNFIYELEKDRIDSTEYHVLTSPFLRCVQTTDSLFKGFQDKHSGKVNWNLALEPGLSEMMNDRYFTEQVPSSIIDSRKSEIQAKEICKDMCYVGDCFEPARDALPVYPEHFQNMMARFVSTLDYVTTFHRGQMSLEEIRSIGTSDSSTRSRRVIIFVTHGAGIISLLWATTRRPGGNDVPYCCVSRAMIRSRSSSKPLSEFGSSRVPSYTWTVDYHAYAQHLASL